MEDNLPFVSIIIPCRNEEKFIGKCLDSIIANDYPKRRLEVLIGDGRSEDRTREIIEKYQKNYSFIRVFDNYKKFAPAAQNIGVKKAKGAIIMIMDAHVVYSKHYISRCVRYLKKYQVENVGGILITLPSAPTLIAKAIALSLSHFFGVGDSCFRKGVEEARLVESVPYGCYKKEVFQKVGLYNENLTRSYDMDFNLRLKEMGGKTLLSPEIVCYYYPKSKLRDFFIHNFQDGVWAILPFKFNSHCFKLRHYIPLIFILTLPLSIWPYILLSLFFSLKIAFKEKDLRLFFLMPLSFGARHFGYGLGSLWGLIKIFLGNGGKKTKRN